MFIHVMLFYIKKWNKVITYQQNYLNYKASIDVEVQNHNIEDKFK